MDDIEQPRRDLSELPTEVVDLLVLWVSRWLTQADKTDVPPELAPVAGFRPGFRHRDPRARSTLEQALNRSEKLSQQVHDWLDSEDGPGTEAQAGETVEIARAWLRGDGEAVSDLLAKRESFADASPSPSDQVSHLEKQIAELQAEVASAQHRHRRKAHSRREKSSRQSRELADAHALSKRLTSQVHDCEERLASLEVKLAEALKAAADSDTSYKAQIRSLESELAQAQRERSQDRRSSRYLERLDVARVQVLLSAAQSAMAGLTREISSGATASPTDLLRSSDLPSNPLPRRPGANQLADWLVVPGLHLLVDGYNVTKAATPDLPLAQQREFLVGRLCALAARTSAEVTVVFDAQYVSLAMPSASRKGARVIFTDEGEIADDVIVDLVSVEPPGRAVMVITSDQELSSRVTRLGARVVPAQDFNAVLDKG